MKYFLSLIIFLFHINTFASIDNNTLQEIKSYLNSLKKVAIEFEQIDNEGTHVIGKLLIQKPYKFRCNYYPPYPLVIVGNKNYIAIYDYQLEQLTRIKSEENLFSFLLLNNLNLTSNIKIVDTIHTEKYLEVDLLEIDSNQNIKLILNRNPLTLSTLSIQQNSKFINIYFKDIAHLSSIEKELFIIKDPKIFGSPKQFNIKDIDLLMQKY